MPDPDMNFADEVRRQRADKLGPPERAAEAEPVAPRSLTASGQSFIAQVELCQQERDQYRHERDAANARIEQFQIAITDLQSQLETARLETRQANDTLAGERAERVRYGVAIEQAIDAFRNIISPKKTEDENPRGG